MTAPGAFGTLVKGATIAFSGNSLIYVLAFIFQIFLVRLLGSDGYGVWGFAFTLILTVAQLSTLGLGYAAVYFSSRGGAGARNAARSAIVNVFLLSVAAALVLPVAARRWILPAYRFENLDILIYVLSAAIPLVAFTSIAESVFKAHHDAVAAYKMKLVPEALKLLLIPAAMLWFGADVRVVAVTMLVILAAPAVYGAYMLNKLVLPLRTLFQFEDYRSSTAPILSYAFPFFLLEVFQLFRDRVDTFVIGYISTAHYLGVYKGAYVLAALVSFVPNAVVYLLFPLLTRVMSEKGLGEVVEFGENTVKFLIYSGVPLVVFVSVFSRPLMTRVMGQEFLDGERALILLSLSAGSGIFHAFYGHILAAKQQIMKAVISNIVAFAAVLILNVLLIPRYGITGAGAASLAGSLLLTIFIVGFSTVSMKKLIFPRSVIGALFIALAVFLAAYFLRERSFAVSVSLFLSFCGLWVIWIVNFERSAAEAARNWLQRWKTPF